MMIDTRTLLAVVITLATMVLWLLIFIAVNLLMDTLQGPRRADLVQRIVMVMERK